MKRVLTVAFIAFYVGALTYGIICHLIQDGRASHPMMYFVIFTALGMGPLASAAHAEGVTKPTSPIAAAMIPLKRSLLMVCLSLLSWAEPTH